MCENDVAFVSFLWSITVKTNPERNRSQWTTKAVVGFYSFLVCLSVNVCVSFCAPCIAHIAGTYSGNRGMCHPYKKTPKPPNKFLLYKYVKFKVFR